MSRDAPPSIYRQAEFLRKNLTPAEEKLWIFLRKKPGGFKFRRQRPFHLYVLDFYCHKVKLAIELNGSIHENTLVQDKDDEREAEIRKLGIEVIRFSNDQVLTDVHRVVLEILSVVTKRLLDPSLQGGLGG